MKGKSIMSFYGTYCRCNVHVYDSNLTVIRAARRKIAKKARRNPKFRAMRKEFYKRILDCHAKARGIVRAFRL